MLAIRRSCIYAMIYAMGFPAVPEEKSGNIAALQMGDELLGNSSGTAGMGSFPFDGLCTKFRNWQANVAFTGY